MMNIASLRNFSGMRPTSVSITLHAVMAAWLLSNTTPAEIMPQQMIQVTLVDAAENEPSETKPTPPSPVKSAQEAPAKPKAIPPVAEKEPAPVLQKAEPAPSKPVDEQAMANISPAAGSAGATKPDAQMVTTTPLFDAEYLRNPAPDYPAQAKRRSMQGVVMIRVVVREDGTAKSADIHESSGFALLDSSAQAAVARWKFVPAKRDGAAVEAQVIVPIEFKLS